MKRDGVFGEEGGTLAETAISFSIFFAVLFGIFEMSVLLYDYAYVANAARQASRYAMVRGYTSCKNTPGLTNCGVTPDQIQSYVRGLGYPGVNTQNVTVTTTWLTASSSTPTTWTACTTSTCNVPGNLVNVKVSYSYPINIPYSYHSTISISSASQLVISQ